MLSVLKPVRVCLATLLALVVQFSLGMIVNLYVTVPPSDQHASFVQEVETAPFLLTVHVLVGLLLISAAAVFVVRAIGTRDRLVIALAGTGLVAILGAFAAGEAFARSGQPSVSLTMGVLTSVALGCYVITLGRLGAGRRHREAAASLPEDYLSLGYGMPRHVGPVSGLQQAAVTGPLRHAASPGRDESQGSNRGLAGSSGES